MKRTIAILMTMPLCAAVWTPTSALAQDGNGYVAAYPFILEHQACVRDPSEPDMIARLEKCSDQKPALQQRFEAILPKYSGGPDMANAKTAFEQALFDIDKRARLEAKHGKTYTSAYIDFVHCFSSAVLAQERFGDGRGFRGQAALKTCETQRDAVLADRRPEARKSRDAVNAFRSVRDVTPSFEIR